MVIFVQFQIANSNFVFDTYRAKFALVCVFLFMLCAER